MRKTLYDVLSVTSDADDNAIERAYRQQVARLAKEAGALSREDAEIRSKALKEAYAVLGDRTQRARYDNSLQPEPRATVTRGGGGMLKWVLLVLAALIFAGSLTTYQRMQAKRDAELQRQAEIDRERLLARHAEEEAAREAEAAKRQARDESWAQEREEQKRQAELERVRRELDRDAERRIIQRESDERMARHQAAMEEAARDAERRRARERLGLSP
ncbi:DnaJ domain-containing protein [Uliginosibacterium sp. H1]|uniref:DnaJ domain-containing protein n=1 Tax=Uliginosibacterium sp. H1 TaxID=3114757 RepID=UPI002E19F29E|nr:DnaJ domain-containing protein [Uliginosibacterium sp. H1]